MLGAAPAVQISLCGMRIQENASSSRLRAQVIVFRKIKRSLLASSRARISADVHKRYSSGSTSFSEPEQLWSCVQFTNKVKGMKTRRGRRESQREARRSGEAKPRIWLNPTTTTTKMRCSACANLRMMLMLCPLHQSPYTWTTTKTTELLLLNTFLAYDPLHALERRIVCLQLPLLNYQLLRICPRNASS